MKAEPYFTIILPTKNRSEILSVAIDSVMKQSFGDFELIVVDNDDDPEATRNVVGSFLDERVRYFRTGSYSMVENWEFGREQARGKYITVLEDKQAYYSHALESLYNILNEEDPYDIVVWRWDASENSKNDSVWHSDDYKKVKSATILGDYIQGRHPWQRLPRMLNSCISKQLMENVVDKNDAFFIYYSPDLCAAFMQLAAVDELLITRRSIGYLHSNQSNALMLRKDKQKATNYFSGRYNFDQKEAVSRVPIKNSYIIQNTVYNDFLNVREKYIGKLKSYVMRPEAYARMCMRDLIITKTKGGSIECELRDVDAYIRKNIALYGRLKLRLWYWAKVSEIYLRKLLLNIRYANR